MDLKPTIRTPLKQARGLGAAHSGTHHFWLQRVSAVALIPLTMWFLVELLATLLGGDRGMMIAWMRAPFTALLMATLIVALFMHARLGVQTILEDYVHSKRLKIALLLTLNFLTLGFGAMALMAIAHLHFVGL